MKFNIRDYFDPAVYAHKVNHARQAWDDLMSGKRRAVVFMNLCAPFLCDLFGVEPLEYYTNLDVMIETQLKGIAWRLKNLDEDEIPRAVFLDQATLHEAIAFDLPVEYREGSPPWGGRLLTKIEQVDRLQEPGLYRFNSLSKTRDKLEIMRSKVSGLPVMTSVHLHAPFTMAAQLLGAQELCLACLDNPRSARRLLEFCVRFYLIFEQVKWQYGISPEPLDEFVCWREAQVGLRRIWVSDDTTPMISPKLYERFVLPYNRSLFANFDYIHLHMDGRWDHLIPMVRQLQPDFCEVGGETDWPKIVESLGKKTILQGGIDGEMARNGSADACLEAADLALKVAACKARIALTVANEVLPGTPLENMQGIIEALSKLHRDTRRSKTTL